MGVLFYVLYGILNVILLFIVLEFIKISVMKRLVKIGCSLNKDLYLNFDEEVVDYIFGEIKKFCFDFCILNLKEYGIDEIEFENVIFKMVLDVIESGSLVNNLCVLLYDEIKELYWECFNYKYKEFIKILDC